MMVIYSIIRLPAKKNYRKRREVKGLRKDGTQFPFRLAVSEVQFQERIIYTGFIHDLSKEKEAEEFLKKYTLELEELVENRTKSLKKCFMSWKKQRKKLIYLWKRKRTEPYEKPFRINGIS
jgi:hypothetical protein